MKQIAFLTAISMIFFSFSTASATTPTTGEIKQTIMPAGTGGETGNYYGMMEDIKSYCEESLPNATINNQITSGSDENVTGATQKKFVLFMTQEDVLRYYAKKNSKKVNKNRMKIVTGLHNEPAHLLIPVGYQPKGESKSMWASALSKVGLGGDDKPKGISLDLLKNQKVGSWGGSLTSTKALSSFMGLNLDVFEIPEEQRAAGGNFPILLVGGAPYEPVETLLATGKYNLVPIDHSLLAAKADFYMPADVTYKVGGKMQNVATFAVRAYLMGKSFRKESKNQNMVLLAQCISDSLIDLADDSETNSNWETVYELEEAENSQTSWAYFPIK